jgi:four helix bundle protein
MNGPIYIKTVEFSVKVVGLHGELRKNHEFVISEQLLRAGTSIGANVNEAASAQSRKDFISKMSIAQKEARETKYWLTILSESKRINPDQAKLLDDIEEIIKIISKIIITAKNNLTK